jgi:hypothetical protein
MAQRGVKTVVFNTASGSSNEVKENTKILTGPLRWAVDIANVASFQIERKDPPSVSAEVLAEDQWKQAAHFDEQYKLYQEHVDDY